MQFIHNVNHKPYYQINSKQLIISQLQVIMKITVRQNQRQKYPIITKVSITITQKCLKDRYVVEYCCYRNTFTTKYHIK